MTENIIHHIPFVGTSIVLYRSNYNNRTVDLIMESIEEKEFKKLSDRNYNYKSLKHGIISNEDISAFKVDFNKESFINYINSLSIIDNEGYIIPSNINFETSEIISHNKGIKWYQTWDTLKKFKHKYCLIGKPKYIILFKTSIKL